MSEFRDLVKLHLAGKALDRLYSIDASLEHLLRQNAGAHQLQLSKDLENFGRAAHIAVTKTYAEWLMPVTLQLSSFELGVYCRLAECPAQQHTWFSFARLGPINEHIRERKTGMFQYLEASVYMGIDPDWLLSGVSRDVALWLVRSVRERNPEFQSLRLTHESPLHDPVATFAEQIIATWADGYIFEPGPEYTTEVYDIVSRYSPVLPQEYLARVADAYAVAWRQAAASSMCACTVNAIEGLFLQLESFMHMLRDASHIADESMFHSLTGTTMRVYHSLMDEMPRRIGFPLMTFATHDDAPWHQVFPAPPNLDHLGVMTQMGILRQIMMHRGEPAPPVPFPVPSSLPPVPWECPSCGVPLWLYLVQNSTDGRWCIQDSDSKKHMVESTCAECNYAIKAYASVVVAKNRILPAATNDDSPEDESKSVELLTEKCNSGHVSAQIELAMRYLRGNTVGRNEKEALRLLKLASDQGSARARDRIGAMYESGRLGTPSLPDAAKWFLAAAEQGYAQAQYNVWRMHDAADGKGLNYGEDEANAWCRLAAEQGDARAQLWLGMKVERDRPCALGWIRRAVEQGLDEAQYYFGGMFEQGIIVEKDYAEAQRWYDLAAKQGYEPALRKTEKTLGQESHEGSATVNCPDCGGEIPLDGLEEGTNTCPHCRSQFLVEFE